MKLVLNAHTHHVWSGEMYVGQGEQVLTALLGSCVGIGVIWRAGRCCGLAHCLLPDASASTDEDGARYVSAAVPALLRRMGVKREQYAELEVVVAGGANMLTALRGSSPVGRRNVAAAHAQLEARGLRVSHQDVGGSQGRRLSIDCNRHSYSVVKVGVDHAVQA